MGAQNWPCVEFVNNFFSSSFEIQETFYVVSLFLKYFFPHLLQLLRRMLKLHLIFHQLLTGRSWLNFHIWTNFSFNWNSSDPPPPPKKNPLCKKRRLYTFGSSHYVYILWSDTRKALSRPVICLCLVWIYSYTVLACLLIRNTAAQTVSET